MKITKLGMAKKYGVAYNTFNKWINRIPDIGLTPKQRILTPKQIEIIYRELGCPSRK